MSNWSWIKTFYLQNDEGSLLPTPTSPTISCVVQKKNNSGRVRKYSELLGFLMRTTLIHTSEMLNSLQKHLFWCVCFSGSLSTSLKCFLDHPVLISTLKRICSPDGEGQTPLGVDRERVRPGGGALALAEYRPASAYQHHSYHLVQPRSSLSAL